MVTSLLLFILLFGFSPTIAQIFDQEGIEINGEFLEILSFEIVDFDEDGDLDLFLTCGEHYGRGYPDCELYYLENDGEARFEIHPLITLDDGTWWIRNIEIVDFDGDGDLDIVIPGGEGEDEGWHSMTILFHDGNLEFTTHSFLTGELEPYLPYEVRVIDFDSNGFLDMVVGFYGPDPRGNGVMWGALYVYLQIDSLEFSALVLDEWSPRGGWWYLQAIQLVEEDEIVVFAEAPWAVLGWLDAKVLWRWEQDEFVMTLLPPGEYGELRWCDWDGDGRLDYVAWGYPPSDTMQIPPVDSLRVRLFRQNDDGEFEHQPLTPGLLPYPRSLEIADFDGDEHPDVFFTTPGQRGANTAFVLFGNRENDQLTEVLPNYPISVDYLFKPADLNGDGRVDLIASARREIDDENQGFLV